MPLQLTADGLPYYAPDDPSQGSDPTAAPSPQPTAPPADQPPPAPIKLIPVDHEPEFHHELHPVDHDPFADVYPPDDPQWWPQPTLDDKVAQNREQASRFVESAAHALLGAPMKDAQGNPAPTSYGLPGAMWDWISQPGQMAQTPAGPQMPTTGTWSDEDEAMRQIGASQRADQEAAFGVNTVMNGVGANMPFAKPNSAGIFGGRLAQTADHAKLAQAEQLEAQGEHPGIIWSQTGWNRGADGQWRFEIPDQASTFTPPNDPTLQARLEDVESRMWQLAGDRDPVTNKMRDEQSWFDLARQQEQLIKQQHGISKAGDVLQHPELYAAYPGAAKLPVAIDNYQGFRGSYGGPDRGIELDKETGAERSTMLHEMQHHIQRLEGFAPGGGYSTPEVIHAADAQLAPRRTELLGQLRKLTNARDAWVQGQLQEMRPHSTPEDISDYMQRDGGRYQVEILRTKYWNTFPQMEREVNRIQAETNNLDRTKQRLIHDAYKRLAGEVEARNVQDRAGLSARDRRASPTITEDTPRERQIVRQPDDLPGRQQTPADWEDVQNSGPSKVRIVDRGDGMFDAKVGNKIAGRLILDVGDRKGTVFKVVVNEGYRRQGIARQLYEAVEKSIGGPLRPSSALADDGFAFWKSYRPEAVANDLRMHRDTLLGQPVTSSYGPGKITSVGSGGAIATIDGKNSTFFVPRQELERIIADNGSQKSLQSPAEEASTEVSRWQRDGLAQVQKKASAQQKGELFEPEKEPAPDRQMSMPEPATVNDGLQEPGGPDTGADHGQGQKANNGAGTIAGGRQGSADLQSRGAGGTASVAAAQAAATDAAGGAAPLAGLPDKPLLIRGKYYVPGPLKDVHDAAADYAREAGIKYDPLTDYVPVDKIRARRIAAAFDKMEHAPDDPKVKASYDAMIDETIAQYHAIERTGLKVEFIKPDMKDPYEESPRLAAQDMRDNKHLWVYPTDIGFGSGDAITDSPMLRKTGIKVDGHDMVANDVFRIVHDYFGHFKDGVGFRADGEENAWRSHSRMYSPLARKAMTTETRGQNSWLNYGPHGAKNRTAKSADTIYAEQKVGLMPDWAVTDGAGPGHQAQRTESGPRVEAPPTPKVQTVADPHRIMRRVSAGAIGARAAASPSEQRADELAQYAR